MPECISTTGGNMFNLMLRELNIFAEELVKDFGDGREVTLFYDDGSKVFIKYKAGEGD